MRNKVLIIGGLGYIGSRLTDYLTYYNYECTVFDIGFFKNGKISNIKNNINIKKIDARDIKKNDLSKFDIVVQLAAISNDPYNGLSNSKVYKPTVKYTINIAKYCKELGIKFIFPSSCSIYGYNKKICIENTKANPQTGYSENKYEIENQLKQLVDKNFSPIILRLATVYGFSPRIRFDVVINMLVGMAITENKITLNSNGLAWRPHIHIDDVCYVIKSFIEKKNINNRKHHIINVGSNKDNLRVIEIARIISRISKAPISFLNTKSQKKNSLITDRKINDGVDKRSYSVNFDKLSEKYGISLKYNIKRGIKNLFLELKKIKLEKKLYKKKDFYRLQQLEYLIKKKKINNSLR